MEYEIEKIKHQAEHEQHLLKTRLSNVLQKQHDVQSEANRKVEQYEFEMNKCYGCDLCDDACNACSIGYPARGASVK